MGEKIMFETIIEQLKNPVTSMVEKSKEEGIKKEQ